MQGEAAEQARLKEDARRERDWKRWGPYLSERQWGTVREDYSDNGDSWEYFTFNQAQSRVFRWGEDGLMGITDRQGRLCFALALWNGRDQILKERLFGLTGPQGNHGEDVKEIYFYLDSTPTHSYMKALYRYPQLQFPYDELIAENGRRGYHDPEYELLDTGIFADDRYFDIIAEYAKASPNDILIRITIKNRGSEGSVLHLLPTIWFRNTWSWGRVGEGYWKKPGLKKTGANSLIAEHESLGRFHLFAESTYDGTDPGLLFTENETNNVKLFKVPNKTSFVKDAFHEYIIGRNLNSVNPGNTGTKAAFYYLLNVTAGGAISLRLRLVSETEKPEITFGAGFESVFSDRIKEADEFYESRIPAELSEDEKLITRQGYAGLLWTKQFYYYSVKDWLEGDPGQPAPPPERKTGRNSDWNHLYNRDIISMPDKWEYPWYAAWDLGFHMIPMARIDPEFAKQQLILFLREWYMHPNGQIPAYEYSLSDVNPPVHAWAAWRVYKMTGTRGNRDVVFLSRVFQKLLLNFTWWVNRKDVDGKHIFSGGFLGLDNIGIFDRSQTVPGGGLLEQADGTAWMAFFCATMLSIALELARYDRAYEDIASKFFEHFIAIADAINHLAGTGLWNEEDGFYYDHLHIRNTNFPLRIRSLVGLIPIVAVEILEENIVDKLPGFKKRMQWFLTNRQDLAGHISYMECLHTAGKHIHRLLAIPSKEKLLRVLAYLFDENEFLSPHGIRSLSRVYKDNPYIFRIGTREFRVDYIPGESNSGIFGGNSNWRGPVWFPLNYLIIEALERYYHYYGDSLRVEFPTGSGNPMNLLEISRELYNRLVSIFQPDERGFRPCHGQNHIFALNPFWRNLILFHEYFHGDTGKGCGANHQTGWTALLIKCYEKLSHFH